MAQQPAPLPDAAILAMLAARPPAPAVQQIVKEILGMWERPALVIRALREGVLSPAIGGDRFWLPLTATEVGSLRLLKCLIEEFGYDPNEKHGACVVCLCWGRVWGFVCMCMHACPVWKLGWGRKGPDHGLTVYIYTLTHT
jgi:hypothetical protein